MLLHSKLCKEKVAHAERACVPEYLADAKSSQCCARYCLSQEPDFLAQREWLREVVEGAGHEIIFYPKYHCELNYIDMIWANFKARLQLQL
jgi:hypothetical protein